MIEGFRNLRESVSDDVFLMAQIGEGNEEGFEHAVAEYDRAGDVDGIELNLSCPHIEKGGILIGGNPEVVASIVRASRRATDRPLIVKLNAGVDRLEEVAAAAAGAGADALSAINTIGGPNPEISKGFGGLSGGLLFPVTVAAVRRIRSVVSLPIICMGGIRGAANIRTLQEIDPDFHFAIGTALGGLDSEGVKHYFHQLEQDLVSGTDLAAEMTLSEKLMEYTPFVVSEIEEYGESIRLLRFHQNLDAGIGQFVFLKVGTGFSKPFSVASDREGLELVFRRVGKMTSKAFELKVNDVVRIRGPYGREFSFPEDRQVVFVGAGCGIAPVMHAAEHHPGPKRFVLGAVTEDELTYIERLRALGPLDVSTDDGSAGYQGYVGDLLEEVLEREDVEGALYFNCGPEVAMAAADRVERRFAPAGDIYHLVERVTSCAIGICGKCSIPNGKRLCIDGPVFTAAEFTPDEYTRDKTGRKIIDPHGSGGPGCKTVV